MKRQFTQEQKDKIIAAYNAETTLKQICTDNDVNTYEIYEILAEANVPKRYPSKSIPHNKIKPSVAADKKRTMRCPCCNRETPKAIGVRFCIYCGADIRDKREIALENLNKLYLLVKDNTDGVELCTALASFIKGV